MKKSLLPLAVAASFAAAPALADITVGGQLQTEIVSVSSDSGDTEGLFLTDGMEGGSVDKGTFSAFFIKGAHDLGNGLTALYKVNTDPKFITKQGATLAGRDAFIGIKGSFGTILAGRIATPYKTSTVKWDPFVATFMQGRNSGGTTPLHNGYADNVVAYANKFGPATVVAAVAFDESVNTATGETNANHAYTGSVNIPVGPVELAVAFLDGGGDNQLATKIGAKFTTGAITVAAQYEDLEENIGNGNLAFLTGSFKAGKNTFSANIGRNDSDDAAVETIDYYAIGLTHSMSKKVRLHTGYTSHGGDNTTDTFGVGVRVKF
ncbi:MAG: porin [bacterium]